jgi:hypothetical protein
VWLKAVTVVKQEYQHYNLQLYLPIILYFFFLHLTFSFHLLEESYFYMSNGLMSFMY